MAENLWPNEWCDPSGPLIGTAFTDPITLPAGGHGGVFSIEKRDHIGDSVPPFPVVEGEAYLIRVVAKRTRGTKVLSAGVWFVNQTSGNPWDTYGPLTQKADLGGGWALYEKIVTVPAGKQSARAFLQIDQATSGGETQWLIAGPLQWKRVADLTVGAKDQVTLAVLPSPSYVRTYYLLQASGLAAPAKPTTNPPASPWTTTEPSYTEGSTNTLYTVMVTAYGSVAFEYGDVQKSSSYEAAKAAYNKAVAAANAASGALTVANGKISLGGLGVANPPTIGHSGGDLILTRDAAGKVNGVKIMDASKHWVAYTLLADQILVPGSAGTISLADDAVTAPKIFADEALLKKLLVRRLTAGEIDVQDLLLSGQFKTAGFDEGRGVLIDQGGVVAKGTDADGNESLAILGSDGALTAVGANLVGGSLTINAEDGDATHFGEGFESGVISTTFKQPDRWLEVIESGFSTPEINSTAHTGAKSLAMSHKRTVGNSFGSGSYIRNESKIQIDLTGLNPSLSSYLLSFWLYIPNYKTYGDLRAVESKIQVLNWSQESGNLYYPTTSLSLSGSSLSDLGTGWVHIENVKLVAASTLRVIIKAELSLDNTSTPALPCYLDDVAIDGNFGQSSVRISSADGANILWTDEVGAQIGKLGVNPALGTIKMTTPRLDTSQDVGLGGKLYVGNNSSMLFASPSQVGDLPNGTNLDYKTEPGWFVTTENPTGIVNSPVSGGFMLRVERLSPTTFIIPSSGVLQTLVTPDGATYTRSRKSAVWSAWTAVSISPQLTGVVEGRLVEHRLAVAGGVATLNIAVNGGGVPSTEAWGVVPLATISAGARPSINTHAALSFTLPTEWIVEAASNGALSLVRGDGYGSGGIPPGIDRATLSWVVA